MTAPTASRPSTASSPSTTSTARHAALAAAGDHLPGCSIRTAGGRPSWRPTSPWTPRTCCSATSSGSSTRTWPQASARWIRANQHDDGTWGTFYGGPPTCRPPSRPTWPCAWPATAADSPHAARRRRLGPGQRRDRGQPGVHPDLAGHGRPVGLGRPAGAAARDHVPAARGRRSTSTTSAAGPARRSWPSPSSWPTGRLGRCRSASTSCGPRRSRAGAAPAPDQRAHRPGPAASALDRLLHRYERLPALVPPPPGLLRRAALRRAEHWIVRRQEADGCWGGIQPPVVYSIIALHLQGYPLDHPVMRGRPGRPGGLHHPRRPRAAGSRPASRRCGTPPWPWSPWPTPASTPDDPALRPPAEWLLGEEITVPRRLGGAPAPPGARRLGVRVRQRQLSRHRRHRRGGPGPAPRRRGLGPRRRGLRPGGGLDGRHAVPRRRVGRLRRRQRQPPGRRPPLLRLRRGHRPAVRRRHRPRDRDAGRRTRRPARRAVERGVAWLSAQQEADGSWFGRWGVNYVYGTGAAVPALVAAGVAPDDPRIRRAVAWLEDHQNPDGGWGEDLRSYVDDAVAGPGRLHRLADGLGPPGPAGRRRGDSPATAAGRRLAGRQPAARRHLGRALVHRHRLSRGTSPSTTTSTAWSGRSWPSAGTCGPSRPHEAPSRAMNEPDAARCWPRCGSRPGRSTAASRGARVVRTGAGLRRAAATARAVHGGAPAGGGRGGRRRRRPGRRAGSPARSWSPTGSSTSDGHEVPGPPGVGRRSSPPPCGAGARRAPSGPIVSTDSLVKGPPSAPGWPPPGRWPSTWRPPPWWACPGSDRSRWSAPSPTRSSGNCCRPPSSAAAGGPSAPCARRLRCWRTGRPPSGPRRCSWPAPARSAPGSSGPSRPWSGRSTASAPRSTSAARSSTTATWWPTSRRAGAIFVHELDEVPDGATVVFSAHGVAPAVRAEAAAPGPAGRRRHLPAGGQGPPRGAPLPGPRLPGRPDRPRRPRRDRGHPRRGRRHHPGRGRRRRRRPATSPTPTGWPTSPRPPCPPTTSPAWSAPCRDRFPAIVGPHAADVCYATQNRQDAVRAIAGDCDLVLVIGSANSSNTARLAEVAPGAGCRAQLLEDETELRPGLAARTRQPSG